MHCNAIAYFSSNCIAEETGVITTICWEEMLCMIWIVALLFPCLRGHSTEPGAGTSELKRISTSRPAFLCHITKKLSLYYIKNIKGVSPELVDLIMPLPDAHDLFSPFSLSNMQDKPNY
jgi:hypothetical protein